MHKKALPTIEGRAIAVGPALLAPHALRRSLRVSGWVPFDPSSGLLNVSPFRWRSCLGHCMIQEIQQTQECAGSMTTSTVSHGAPMDLGAIETIVKQGKTVITTEDAAIIDVAIKALEQGHTATFYLKDSLFTEIIRRRYATQERAIPVNMEPLSPEEAERIKKDFNIELDGFSTKEACLRCQSIYGTYEFIRQGIKEHGEEAVRAVFSLKHVSVLQTHPRQHIICQNCGLALTLARAVVVEPHSYLYRSENHGYACCR